MANLERRPNRGPRHRVFRGGGRANPPLPSAGATRVSVLTPGLTIGLMIGITALFCRVRDADEPERAPGLPPLARGMIRTGGGIVGQLAFHPSDGGLFSGDALAGGIQSWDPNSGLLRSRFEDPLLVLKCSAMALSPDGRTVAMGLYDNGIAVWDTGTGRLAARLAPESWHASALGFTPDGRVLVAAGWDGAIRTWDTSTWEARVLWSSPDEGGWTCLGLMPDGRTVAAGGRNGWLRSWDLASGRPLAMIRGDGSALRCLAYSPDGRTLAAGSWLGRISRWDAATHRERPHPDRPGLSSVVCLAFAPDGRSLATGHEDRVVRLWDPETGRLLRQLEGHRHGVRSLAFSPDGRALASGAADATILLWDLARVQAPEARARPAMGLGLRSPMELALGSAMGSGCVDRESRHIECRWRTPTSGAPDEDESARTPIRIPRFPD